MGGEQGGQVGQGGRLEQTDCVGVEVEPRIFTPAPLFSECVSECACVRACAQVSVCLGQDRLALSAPLKKQRRAAVACVSAGHPEETML